MWEGESQSRGCLVVARDISSTCIYNAHCWPIISLQQFRLRDSKMGALLHLFAVVPLLCNGVLAQKPSSPDDCAGSQTCTNTEPYKSAPLTPPNALMDLLSSHDLGKESWQDERHPRGFQKRAWKRCVQ
jgi:hypothetical protein